MKGIEARIRELEKELSVKSNKPLSEAWVLDVHEIKSKLELLRELEAEVKAEINDMKKCPHLTPSDNARIDELERWRGIPIKKEVGR